MGSLALGAAGPAEPASLNLPLAEPRPSGPLVAGKTWRIEGRVTEWSGVGGIVSCGRTAGSLLTFGPDGACPLGSLLEERSSSALAAGVIGLNKAPVVGSPCAAARWVGGTWGSLRPTRWALATCEGSDMAEAEEAKKMGKARRGQRQEQKDGGWRGAGEVVTRGWRERGWRERGMERERMERDSYVRRAIHPNGRDGTSHRRAGYPTSLALHRTIVIVLIVPATQRCDEMAHGVRSLGRPCQCPGMPWHARNRLSMPGPRCHRWPAARRAATNEHGPAMRHTPQSG